MTGVLHSTGVNNHLPLQWSICSTMQANLFRAILLFAICPWLLFSYFTASLAQILALFRINCIDQFSATARGSVVVKQGREDESAEN